VYCAPAFAVCAARGAAEQSTAEQTAGRATAEAMRTGKGARVLNPLQRAPFLTAPSAVFSALCLCLLLN
jgi:hypothetical protein